MDQQLKYPRMKSWVTKTSPRRHMNLVRYFCLGTTFELMDFLACAQVAATARMVEEHAKSKMIQRALMGELEPQEDRALQKHRFSHGGT